MEKVLDKRILEPYIKLLLDKYSFLYGFSDIIELENRIRKVNKVIISDKREKNTVMSVSLTDNNLYINANRIQQDIDGNFILEFDKASDFVKHSFIHELMHLSSIRNGYVGIVPINKGGCKNILNEGLTQMLTDEVCGYYEDKSVMSYDFPKVVAHILRASFGNDVILDAYFKDPNALDKAIDNTAISKAFKSYLYVSLTLCSRAPMVEKQRRENNILKSMVVNIIAPTFQKLDEKKKEQYLSRLLYSISGDTSRKAKLIEYINQYLNLPIHKLLDVDTEVFCEYERIENESEAIKELPSTRKILARDDGNIEILGKHGKYILNREYKEQVYLRLFELNGYDKYLTEGVISAYEKAIKQGKKINISQKSILTRRILFCGIKDALFKRGYILLNDYEEFNKNESVQLKYINRKITMRDFKEICKCFSICKNRIGKNKYTYSIIYNSTKNEVEDVTIKRIAFFAINWLNSVKKGEEADIEEAFSPKMERTFEAVKTDLFYAATVSGNYDASSIAKDSLHGDIIRRMLKTPEQVEWIFSFINLVSPNEIFQERKGLSTSETNNPYYLKNESLVEAREIMRKNR